MGGEGKIVVSKNFSIIGYKKYFKLSLNKNKMDKETFTSAQKLTCIIDECTRQKLLLEKFTEGSTNDWGNITTLIRFHPTKDLSDNSKELILRHMINCRDNIIKVYENELERLQKEFEEL